MRVLDKMKKSVVKSIASGQMAMVISIILANVLTEPVAEDLKATFGTALWYHPATVWAVLFAIVWVNTSSLASATMLVLAYEALKLVWRWVRPDAPKITRIRRLLDHARTDTALDEEDVRFIDKITPANVAFVHVEEHGGAQIA